MNRSDKRVYIRNIKGKKGLTKRRTKGAFGEKPAYLKEDKIPDIVVKQPEMNKPYKIEDK